MRQDPITEVFDIQEAFFSGVPRLDKQMTHVGSQWLLLLKQLSKFVQVVGLEHTPVECHPLEHLTGLKSL